MLVLCSITFPCTAGATPALALQSLQGAGSHEGSPSVICAPATTALIILLFYQDGNSTAMFSEISLVGKISLLHHCVPKDT